MIGVFDSGLGGLTALSELHRRLPLTDLCYFGDTARMPYGTRSDGMICRYAEEAVDFLQRLGASRILAACGTVSSVALPRISLAGRPPVCGVIEPTVAAAVGRRIAVLGTTATVGSHTFRDRLREKLPEAEIRELGCPLFVSLVENRLTGPGDPAVTELVFRTLSPLFDFSPDCVILGCTHFPLLQSSIRTVFPKARLVNSAGEAARYVARTEKLPPAGEWGRIRIFVSDRPETFRERAEAILGDRTAFTVEQISFDEKESIIRNKM